MKKSDQFIRKEDILDVQHWQSIDYRQRITAKNWKILLLNDDDKVIFRGQVTQLIGKLLGYGVVEVSKKASHEKV